MQKCLILEFHKVVTCYVILEKQLNL